MIGILAFAGIAIVALAACLYVNLVIASVIAEYSEDL